MASPQPPDPISSIGTPHAAAPPHSTSNVPKSAEDERSMANWGAIAAMPEFQALTARKKRFILKGCAFFLVYYFALPVLVGYFPRLMEINVGPVNIAYLFALSQFVMAWVVAAIYVKAASGWDKAAEQIINQAEAL